MTLLIGLICTLMAIACIFLLAALALNARLKTRVPKPLEPGWDRIDEAITPLPKLSSVIQRPDGTTVERRGDADNAPALAPQKGRWDLPLSATGQTEKPH